MKKLIYTLAFVLIVHCTLKIDNCMSQWVPTNGIFNQRIECFVVSGTNIIAGIYFGGVSLSTDNGANWITNWSLNNHYVLSLTVSGANLFAGTLGSGLYLSTNNGSNWTVVINGIPQYINVYALQVLGTNIFAGTGDGIYLSTNNGSSWSVANVGIPQYSFFYSFAVSGTNIFAGGNGVYLSTNNGTSWVSRGGLMGIVNELAVSGTNIFAGTSAYGVYLSTNNGMNWTAINNGLTFLEISALTISGTNIFAGSESSSGVFLSTNNGANWLNKNQGFNPVPSIRSLLIYNNYIFAGTEHNSVWRRSLSEIIGIQNISTEIPSSYSLSQNYPNPFNPTTNIKFDISKLSDVKIVVYDVIGREIQTLVNESLQPGTYEATFDGSSLNSGVYFYKLSAGNFSETKRMVLVK